jgi:hypothetical protein
MLLCIGRGIVASGCPLGDPVRTTLQRVRLQVVDSASGKPVASASVSLKLDHQTPRPQWDEVRGVDRWSHGVTNNQGKADIEVEYTMLDRNRGSTPTPSSDMVNGQRYFIRVETDGSPSEEVSVLMRPGASAKVKTFQLTVTEIHKPRYVETPGPNLGGGDTQL